jgi:hypothetical protein
LIGFAGKGPHFRHAGTGVAELFQLLAEHALIELPGASHVLYVNFEPANGVPVHEKPPEWRALLKGRASSHFAANARH